jgi:phosphoserine phosphatase
MDKNGSSDERYTGLILLTGVDSPGISAALFSTLEPFSITVLDVEQIVIRSRFILTVLIEADPAHAKSIEEDLNICAEKLHVDIALSFSVESTSSLLQKTDLLHIKASMQKFTPGVIAKLSSDIVKVGGNIERVNRSASSPVTTLDFFISGAQTDSIQSLVDEYATTHELEIAIAISS